MDFGKTTHMAIASILLKLWSYSHQTSQSC